MTRLRRIADGDRIFFVTTNLQPGAVALSLPERHLLLKQLARQRDAGEFHLFAYVVMPTHLHLLFAPRRVGLVSIMREFKSRTGQQLTTARGVKGPIWQPRYFDFVLRKVGDFWDKLEYIHQNPVEAQLVEAASLGRGQVRRITIGRARLQFLWTKSICPVTVMRGSERCSPGRSDDFGRRPWGFVSEVFLGDGENNQAHD